jgi:hypothetical protein
MTISNQVPAGRCLPAAVQLHPSSAPVSPPSAAGSHLPSAVQLIEGTQSARELHVFKQTLPLVHRYGAQSFTTTSLFLRVWSPSHFAPTGTQSPASTSHLYCEAQSASVVQEALQAVAPHAKFTHGDSLGSPQLPSPSQYDCRAVPSVQLGSAQGTVLPA